MPIYSEVKENERADFAAKGAIKSRISLYESSLIYIKKGILIAVESKKKMIKRSTPKKIGEV